MARWKIEISGKELRKASVANLVNKVREQFAECSIVTEAGKVNRL